MPNERKHYAVRGYHPSPLQQLQVFVGIREVIRTTLFWIDTLDLAYSTVIDLDARPSCWSRRAFDYVLFHVPRKGMDDIAADLAGGPVDTYKVSVVCSQMAGAAPD
jgi:hypothetical protein